MLKIFLSINQQNGCVYAPHWAKQRDTAPGRLFLHTADVKTAEFFMADAYVSVVTVMASAGTLLKT